MRAGNDLQQFLGKQLQQHGWTCRGRQVFSQRGWESQEWWEISSAWSPWGLRAWLVLEWPYSYLWNLQYALGFAARRPGQGEPWAFVFRTDLRLPLGHKERSGKALERRWRTWLRPFFARLDAWRNERALGAALAETEQTRPAADPWAAPAKWLAPLRPFLSERKWRLFACACLRRLPEVQEDEESLHVVSLAEQYADGLIPKRGLRKARKTSPLSWLPSYEAYDEAVAALEHAARVLPAAQRPRPGALFNDLEPASIVLRPSWLRRNGGIVAAMAQVIYDRHSFADLPILADALEDAGCSDRIVLAHCRKTPTENHARGCWLLDHLLAKP